MNREYRDDAPRVLLLTTARSYRNAAFSAAAERSGIEIVQAVNLPDELSRVWDDGFGISFYDVEASVTRIAAYHDQYPLRAILPVDDSGSILAATAGEALGLAHNSAAAAKATRDKLVMRQILEGSGVDTPRYGEYASDGDLLQVEYDIGFPCVVKPRSLNGSRGVIRADDAAQLSAAADRSARLIRKVEGLSADAAVSLLIESYIPGQEIALEGLLDQGRLQVLAIFDKPDPLVGPFFEETIYVTPSHLSTSQQQSIVKSTKIAAAALGLETGPIHAELRINEHGTWIVEVAGRSIGGLCSQVLQFGTQGSLEEIILRQACGLDYEHLNSAEGARGVMMIPIPGAGLLRGVDGLEAALDIPYVDNIEITTPLDNLLTPLPEGDGYLGFIFSRGPSPNIVERTLREAHATLSFRIDPLLPILGNTPFSVHGS